MGKIRFTATNPRTSGVGPALARSAALLGAALLVAGCAGTETSVRTSSAPGGSASEVSGAPASGAPGSGLPGPETSSPGTSAPASGIPASGIPASGTPAPGAPGPAAAPRGLAEEARQGTEAIRGAVEAEAREAEARKAALLAAARRWGLPQAPLLVPPPPRTKSLPPTRRGFGVSGPRTRGLPPVFTRVPTRDRVVFLTIDDGVDQDPATLRMLRELHVPYTAFLSDDAVDGGWEYFRAAHAQGAALQNHTLLHRYLPGLSRAAQRHEICGMQDTLRRHYGRAATLFRPPYGSYNRDTLEVARSCGIRAVPLWEAEVFPGRVVYRDSDLHPGDLVLTHFQGRAQWNGSMADALRTFLRTVTEKGYAVARLEDYI
ncbi:polysaccharide deacetylase family protein [Streptomyces sp. Tu6071]|uniref:polysaccharide deacetylase family protein n=1 Tax=Streptomyces sp. Tu6071 TaxID=355249 RepID=UPI0002DF1D50|nr:polysaccharide deacetylase family protein [Streptomyces sp. Tu6071]